MKYGSIDQLSIWIVKLLIQNFKGRQGEQNMLFWNSDFFFFKPVIFNKQKIQNFCPSSSKSKYYFIFGASEVVYFIAVDLCFAFFSVFLIKIVSTCLPYPRKISNIPELLALRVHWGTLLDITSLPQGSVILFSCNIWKTFLLYPTSELSCCFSLERWEISKKKL